MNREDLEERLELCTIRLKQIPDENNIKEPFADFFRREADFLLYVLRLYERLKKEDMKSLQAEELSKINGRLYNELLPGNYEKCYGNPEYACAVLGDDYGKLFSALYAELRGVIVYAYEDRLWDLTVSLELFLECYVAFEDEEIPAAKILRHIIYSYNYDYCGEFCDYRLSEILDPDLDFARNIIMNSDLNDLRYLYSYGEYISENEMGVAKFLNSMTQDEIDKMASTYTEGYRLGFIATNKDIKKKKTVNIRYSVGFERMVRSAVKQFEAMGLKSVIYRAASHRMNSRGTKVGYFGATPNPQYDFDHKNDEALFLDERMVTRKLSAQHEGFEARKELANAHGGPAVIEVFGEKPFVPKVKKAALCLTKEQQALRVKYDTESAKLTNRYIIGEERSFTIIAYPIPEIGENFEEIFKETVKINSLDYKKYQKIQQVIIDALDKGEKAVVKGCGNNKTELVINLHKLNNPEKETNFENCVADVNIPVGEVFTSPVLKGTQGTLHVSKVYLNGLCYKDLTIKLEDGMITDYTCSNSDNEEENKKLIKENILYHHETLPIGEFAIGTNTTAYSAAKKYGIEDKFPILIAEKMGPHFAFGDTCYSWEEDIVTYNPDGKAIIARENECSANRKTDLSKAYFNCHTDVTIPYDELGCIYVVTHTGEKIYIIDNSKFVLPGTEELNIPLYDKV